MDLIFACSFAPCWCALLSYKETGENILFNIPDMYFNLKSLYLWFGDLVPSWNKTVRS